MIFDDQIITAGFEFAVVEYFEVLSIDRNGFDLVFPDQIENSYAITGDQYKFSVLSESKILHRFIFFHKTC